MHSKRLHKEAIRRSALSVAALWMLLVPTISPAQETSVEVEITGITDELLAAVRSNLRLYAQRDEPLLNDALIRSLHGKAPGEIQEALRPYGYYRAAVEKTLRRTEDGWSARYEIDPGDPVRISQVDIAIDGLGADDPALKRWREQFPLQAGDILRHDLYERAKLDLRQAARDRGYIDGRLTEHRILVDLASYEASITLHYSTGRRYAFGAVRFSQEAFAEAFLRRYVPFNPGDPYEASQLLVLHRALTDSGYFRLVDISPMLDEAGAGRIPIRVELTPRNRKRYSAGIGYATDTGARGMLGFENRRANRWGHRYDSTLEQSEIWSVLTASYQLPMKRPATDYLSYRASWIDKETDTVERTTRTIGVDVTQQAGAWQRNVGLSYERERFELDRGGDTTLLVPHVRWLRVSADQRVRTRHGWTFSIGFRGAHDELLSDTSFFQVRSGAKYIQGLTQDTRLLLRTSLGASLTGEFVELPPSQRFFAGGDQSVRGYAFESLGPQDAAGAVVGGRHLAVGSIEYSLDVTDKTAFALFFDAGNAFDDSDIDVKRGAGVGFRWWTPVGAIRVDLARALDKVSEPWRLHLTLGPDL